MGWQALLPWLHPRRSRARGVTMLVVLLLGAQEALAAPAPPNGSRGERPQKAAQTLEALAQRLYRYRDHLERTSQRLTLEQALAAGMAHTPRLVWWVCNSNRPTPSPCPPPS